MWRAGHDDNAETVKKLIEPAVLLAGDTEGAAFNGLEIGIALAREHPEWMQAFDIACVAAQSPDMRERMTARRERLNQWLREFVEQHPMSMESAS